MGMKTELQGERLNRIMHVPTKPEDMPSKEAIFSPLTAEELMRMPLDARQSSFRDAGEQYARQYPEAFAKLYPKLYNNIGEFYSPRLLAGALLAFGPGILQHSRELKVDPPPECLDTVIWMPYLIEHKIPTYFIKKDFAQAVLHTDIQIEDWTALHLPFECGAMILERGALPTPHYGDLMFMLWGRADAKYLNTLQFKFQVGEEIVDVVAENLKMLGHLGVFSDGTTFNGEFLQRDKSKAHKIDSREIVENDTFTVPGDREIALQARLLCYGTLLAMMARPELVQRGHRANVVKREDRRQEFWTPNIVGAKYQFRREGPAGTHASPRMHWRRGHFRKQPVGRMITVLNEEGQAERRVSPDRKVIWLEPCLIAAGKEEK